MPGLREPVSERRVDRTRELDALERLEDVADRRQRARRRCRELDTDEDDRYVLPVPERGSELQAPDRRRLDQRDIHADLVRRLAVGEPRLMSELGDYEPEQGPDLVDRFGNQDPRHRGSLDLLRTISAGIWYGTGMNRPRVLVIDDETDVRGLVRELLERAGYDVSEAVDGREGLRSFFESRPDAVLLDVTMPGLDGWTTLERIRDLSDVPVLMLTAHAQELEKVRGLKAGADDYVTKPFGRQELLARVEALLRRRGDRADAPERYDDAAISIDFDRREVTVDEEAVTLTPLEFRLLAAFVAHPTQVLSPDQLLELVWRDGSTSRDQVKLYVGYLRRKLGARGELVETVRGFGYRYRRPAS